MKNKEKTCLALGAIENENISDVAITNLSEDYVDVSVKLALLTVLAGYLEKDKIKVNSGKFINKYFLNSFLSFILNDKRAAPRKFRIDVSFDRREKYKPLKSSEKYDLLLAFSGGADSTAGLLCALDKKFKVKPVYVGFGQKNEKEEIVYVKKILKKLNIKPLIIKIDINKYIDQDWKRWKLGIIPARNYLFAAIAGSILSRSNRKKLKIWICAHKEEINPIHTDKSLRFFKSASKILSALYNKEISVSTPFMNITKPEILAYWHKKWEKKYDLTVNETVSCYFGNNCGVCKACINRAVVFICAGIKIENFKINPFLDKKNLILTSYINSFKSLHTERKLDFVYALNEQRNILPIKLKRFLDINYKKYQKKINKRIKFIRSINNI